LGTFKNSKNRYYGGFLAYKHFDRIKAKMF